MSVDLHPLTAALGATLDRLEWASQGIEVVYDRMRPSSICPVCRANQRQGHAEGCGFVALRQAVERAGELEEALEMADDVLVEFINLRIPDTAHPLGWAHPYDGQLVVRAERAIARSRSLTASLGVSEALAAEGGRET